MEAKSSKICELEAVVFIVQEYHDVGKSIGRHEAGPNVIKLFPSVIYEYS